MPRNVTMFQIPTLILADNFAKALEEITNTFVNNFPKKKLIGSK